MIKYEGYYYLVFPAPKPYVDYVAGNNKRSGVFHNAILFFKNGIVSRASKKTDDIIPVIFNKEDFNDAYPGAFFLEEDILTIFFNKGQMWEVKSVFKIIDNQIICIETNSVSGPGNIYQYQTWGASR